jgi:chromate transporter
VLPAPLIIFATFVGWLAGGGVAPALVMTIAIFLPAFAITLAGHAALERIVDDARVHDVLDGITAGVVGLIAVTAAQLALQLVDTITLALVLVAACAALWRSSSPLVIPAVMLGAAVIGAAVA